MGQANIDLRPGLDKMLGYPEGKLEQIYERVKDASAVLVMGPTGSGKTTLAMALAEKITDTRSIVTVNAADKNGIDDMRKLVADASRRTLSGGKRVVIVDEVQGTTKQGISTLLTPLETPRASTLWFFCTNEPERLPQVFHDRCLKLRTPSWSQSDLMKIAKRAAKRFGYDIPKDLKQFENPRQLLTFMQMPDDEAATITKPTQAAKLVLKALLGEGGGKFYDFKYSSIMEISLAVRSIMGATFAFEKPNPELVAMLKKADPRLVARIANACSVGLRDPNQPPMVILDIFMGAAAAPGHFEK